MTEEYPLIYGSVIKIKTINQKYDNQLFFIRYINKTNISLISNNNLNDLTLEINDDGSYSDVDIQELELIYMPPGGYAMQHNLVVNTNIEIVFNEPLENGLTSLKGTIIELEEDMISVKLNKLDDEDDNQEDNIIYIDFHYSGIDERYNIDTIKIHKEKKAKETGDFFIDLKQSELDKINEIKQQKLNEVQEYQEFVEDDVKEEPDQFMQIYSVEQQIDDYIQRNFRKKVNKKRVKLEVNRYKELLDKYVDLPNGIYKKSYANNNILNYASSLKMPFIYPKTQYGYKEIHVNEDMIPSELSELYDNYNNTINDNNTYNILLKTGGHAFSNDLETFNLNVDNIEYSKQKREPFHKYIKYPIHNKIYLSSYEPFTYEHFYSVKNHSLEIVNSYYTNINNGDKVIIDGFLLPSKDEFNAIQNHHSTQPLLNKSIQSLKPYIAKENRKIITQDASKIKDSCELFGDNLNYFPFEESDKKLFNYFSKLGLNRKLIYNCFGNNFKNINTKQKIIEFLSNFGIHDIDRNTNIEIGNIVYKNNKEYRKNIALLKNKVKSLRLRHFNYKINHITPLPNDIAAIYNIDTPFRKTTSELFNFGNIDTFNAYCFDMIMKHIDLNIYNEGEQSELNNIVEELERNLKNVMNNEDEALSQTKRYVKTYNSVERLLQDENKIVLRDTKEGENPINFIYLKINKDKNLKYNEDIDEFYAKIKKILESNDLNIETHKDLFDDVSILEFLFTMIIEMKLQNTDRVRVLKEDNKVEFYVYNNEEFIKENEYKKSMKKKRILKIRNRELDFDDIKQEIVNDYIVELVNDIKKQKNRNSMLKKLEDDNYLEKLKRKYIRKKNIEMLKRIKNNENKKNIGLIFKNSNYLSNVKVSPYKNILLYILSIEDDDELKYTYITKFIEKFTVDTDDSRWFYCIKTGVKLVPKYLLVLANAYLVNNDHDKMLDIICKNEGSINDTNDAWVHVESGYILKRIEFDDADMYDRNAVSIVIEDDVLDDVLVLDDEELDSYDKELLEEMEDVDTIMNKDVVNLQLNKKLLFSDEEKQIDHLLISFNNILGIKIENSNIKLKLIKEINNTYKNAIYSGENDPVITLIISILSFILVYVQAYDVIPKKSFPGCLNSFNGFPIELGTGNNEGVTYMACVLYGLSNKNPNFPYNKFNNKTRQDIFDLIFSFIDNYVIQNNYVFNLLTESRENRLKNKGLYNREIEIRLPSYFRPSLKEIDVDRGVEFKKSFGSLYEEYQYKINELEYQTKSLEQYIQDNLTDEKPILMTKNSQPFMINYCCDNMYKTSSLYFDYIFTEKNGKNKTDIENIKQMLKGLHINSNKINQIHTSNLYIPAISVVKQSPPLPLTQDNSVDFSEDTIYQFFISTFNFDNKRDIPEYLLQFKINKPSERYYNKKDNLKTKIKSLIEHEYVFTYDLMTEVQRVLYMKKQTNNQGNLYYFVADNENIINFKNSLKGKTTEQYFQAFESKMRTNIELYKNYIELFKEQNVINSSRNIIDRIMREDAMTNDEKSNEYNIYKHINYYLINVLPQIIMNKKENNEVVCKHWNLAPQHNIDIKDLYNEYFSFSSKLELPSSTDNDYDEDVESENEDNINLKDKILIFLNSFKDISGFINVDDFKNNLLLDTLYQKFLTTKLLLLYSIDKENLRAIYNSIESIKKSSFIIKLNKSVIAFIEHIFKKSHITYDKIVKKVNNIKQAEKKLKTDYFKEMKRVQRQAEKTKMNLKLGIWSFALDKNRVYKYSKKYYEEDKQEAGRIQNVIDDEYRMNNEGFDTQTNLEDDGSEEFMNQSIMAEESERLGDIVDEENMEDENNYNY